jgi:sugar/nucleoside kinase (ribokinase family)
MFISFSLRREGWSRTGGRRISYGDRRTGCHLSRTRGGKGVLWVCFAELLEVPAAPVLVVDTLGAGDALNVGLAVGLSEKKSTLEAIALGVIAAS